MDAAQEVQTEEQLVVAKYLGHRKVANDTVKFACIEAMFEPKEDVLQLEHYGRFFEKHVLLCDDQVFKDIFRMERNCFRLLVKKMPGLAKRGTQTHQSIPLEKRIGIALFTLGSSMDYQKISLMFGVPAAMVPVITLEFSKETLRILMPEYMPRQFLTQEKVVECVKGFETIGFPQCLGVIDGYHIELKEPNDTVHDYYNYEDYYSTILMALVDHRYRFLYVSVGGPGGCREYELFDESHLCRKLVETELLQQNAKTISGEKVPVVVVGDREYSFNKNVMHPYSDERTSTKEQTCFNYHTFKTLQVAENAFAHLVARFRRIGGRLDHGPSAANAIILCCSVLHNFLISHNSAINDSWLDAAKKAKTREQPYVEFDEDFDNDADAEKIRNAIAVHLASFAESPAAEE